MAEVLGLRVSTGKLIFSALMALAVLPAGATRHLTVEQLQKTLAASVAKHRADAAMMREFGDFDLTERLTDATRTQITTTLHLGPQTTLALQLLADESALLDPPPAELHSDPPPNPSAQKHILDVATAYVTQTLPHLPDFFATRTTYTFNDMPQIFKVNEWPVRAGLHLVDKTSREITYRDDQVVQTSPAPLAVKEQAAQAQTIHTSVNSATAPQAAGTNPSFAASAGPAPSGSTAAALPTAKGQSSAVAAADPALERGLQSFGEFGRLLGIIFVDIQKRAPTFHHWEQTPAGEVAVYRYSVSKADSHYAVNYCCLDENLRTSSRGGGGGRRRGGGAAAGSVATGEKIPFHTVPGYHGSLFIDPATGIVKRLTLEAEMGDGTVSRAATVIEYGQVVIGDRRFICPLRSMNMYEGPAESGQPASELPIDVPQSLLPKGTLYLNETSFSDYHRLGSEIRILTEAETSPAPPGKQTPAIQR